MTITRAQWDLGPLGVGWAGVFEGGLVGRALSSVLNSCTFICFVSQVSKSFFFFFKSKSPLLYLKTKKFLSPDLLSCWRDLYWDIGMSELEPQGWLDFLALLRKKGTVCFIQSQLFYLETNRGWGEGRKGPRREGRVGKADKPVGFIWQGRLLGLNCRRNLCFSYEGQNGPWWLQSIVVLHEMFFDGFFF